MKYSIRDLLWATVVVALVAGQAHLIVLINELRDRCIKCDNWQYDHMQYLDSRIDIIAEEVFCDMPD